MGKVEKVRPGMKNLKIGQRIVVSFQIACGGDCRYCKQKLSLFCDRTIQDSMHQSVDTYDMGNNPQSGLRRPLCSPQYIRRHRVLTGCWIL
ncbi:hypothetical protein K439DRAFT_1626441, partial [Ramaria rubella]